AGGQFGHGVKSEPSVGVVDLVERIQWDVLVAGVVNQQKYLIEFLAAYGDENHIRVERTDGSKRRPLGFYELHFHTRSLPVFFSGSGPSARDRGRKLVQNFSDHREKIFALC